MTKYNYMEAVKEDVKNYIDSEINFEDFDSLEELEEKLNDELWTEDSVTGNATISVVFILEILEFLVKLLVIITPTACKKFVKRSHIWKRK